MLVERGVERLEGGYRWSSDPRLTLASPIRVTEAQVLAWLAGIRCATLLLLADPPAPFLNPAMVEQRVQAVALACGCSVCRAAITCTWRTRSPWRGPSPGSARRGARPGNTGAALAAPIGNSAARE